MVTSGLVEAHAYPCVTVNLYWYVPVCINTADVYVELFAPTMTSHWLLVVLYSSH